MYLWTVSPKFQQEQQRTEGDRTLCSKSTGTHFDSFLKPVSKYSDRKAESSGSIVWNVFGTINTTFSEILGIKDEMSSLRKRRQMWRSICFSPLDNTSKQIGFKEYKFDKYL